MQLLKIAGSPALWLSTHAHTHTLKTTNVHTCLHILYTYTYTYMHIHIYIYICTYGPVCNGGIVSPFHWPLGQLVFKCMFSAATCRNFRLLAFYVARVMSATLYDLGWFTVFVSRVRGLHTKGLLQLQLKLLQSET